MKTMMTIEQWHQKWRLLPAQIAGTGAVIECIDCQHQSASYESKTAFDHARGCPVAEDKPQYPWDDLRLALLPAGRVTPRSALPDRHE